MVDPIDGTVNFSRGLPHACVHCVAATVAGINGHWDDYLTELGVVYDPFLDEMWTAKSGGKARLNGRVIRVSETDNLESSWSDRLCQIQVDLEAQSAALRACISVCSRCG